MKARGATTLTHPRSQTPFGNALARPWGQPPLVPYAAASAGETLFRVEGVCPGRVAPAPADTPACSPIRQPPLVPAASSVGDRVPLPSAFPNGVWERGAESGCDAPSQEVAATPPSQTVPATPRRAALRLAILVLVLAPAAADACTVCMGDSNSNFASAANGAIFLMFGAIGSMLAALSGFGFYLFKRANLPIPPHIQLVEEMSREDGDPSHA